VSDDVDECGVLGGALNLNSTGYTDHGCYGDLPLQRKIPTAEPGIEPGTSWVVERSSDHQVMRLVLSTNVFLVFLFNGICTNFLDRPRIFYVTYSLLIY
jgi:hypothetical protein